MTATILPFPLVRRRDFVLRNAGRLADAQPKTAEKILAHAIKVQAQTMARRGIGPNLIAREGKALETAICFELWRLTILGDTA
jgi:hypothetical protein